MLRDTVILSKAKNLEAPNGARSFASLRMTKYAIWGSDFLGSLRRVVDPRLVAFGEAVERGLRSSRGGVLADNFVFALVVSLTLLFGFAAHLFKRVLVFRQSCFLRVNGASKKEVATISPESQRGRR